MFRPYTNQILERLTFDQLLSVSEPKRVLRSQTVRGPSLAVDAKSDGVYYSFNFRAYPSTEHKRHKGYIKFFKPKKKTPLERVECLVDCDCKDYRYRWAFVNKQRGSSVVGAGSLNQSLNKAPRITNPGGHSGLCKHLIALRDFIYGEYENFDGVEGGTPERLDALVKDVQTQAAKRAEKAATTKRPDKPDPTAWSGGQLYKGPDADKKPEVQKPQTTVRPTASTIRPKGVGSKNELPAEFGQQIQKRFSKVESVVKDVNAISQIIEDAEDVQVDPESSEALQLLRDIRDSLRVLAAAEQGEQKSETGSKPEPKNDESDNAAELPEPTPEV